MAKINHAIMAMKLEDGKEPLCNITYTHGCLKLRSGKYTGLKVELNINDVDTAEK